MNIIEKEISVNSLLTKSNLPASDYVINPYIGCPHACQYCYARFMKRFTGHTEEWGQFLDIKNCDTAIPLNRLHRKTVFMSSVTDCYNPYEEKYQRTRKVLEQLTKADCSLTVSTKSSLILRDMDLFKRLHHFTAAISINTLDGRFQKDMDKADSIPQRIGALKELHAQGIRTVLFLSPIFPYITDCKSIIEATSGFVSEYWFENLNLRGDYKHKILSAIAGKYPQLAQEYQEIYIKKDMRYWQRLSDDLSRYCTQRDIPYQNYFYHSLLAAQKKGR